MRLTIFAAIYFALLPAGGALAQQLDEQQTLGRQLLNQHCAICHLKPQLGAATFGPALNRDSLGGQDSVLREVIGNGTPRMPGFKYKFDAAQLGAIIAYVKTVPAAAAQPAKQ